jgi:hypothetical protein
MIAITTKSSIMVNPEKRLACGLSVSRCTLWLPAE